jgi:hypothetical protein
MAGALDSLFKSVAKDVVAELGTSLDATVTYTRKVASSYNTATGTYYTGTSTYSGLKVPIEFVVSEEEEGREQRQAKIYITPDLIGNNQPTLGDEVSFTYAGSSRTAQITDIRTYRGGQTYLFILLVRF